MQVFRVKVFVRYFKLTREADFFRIAAQLNDDAEEWLLMSGGSETAESRRRIVFIETETYKNECDEVLGYAPEQSAVLLMGLKKHAIEKGAREWRELHDPKHNKHNPCRILSETHKQEYCLIKLNTVLRLVCNIRYIEMPR